MTSKDKRKFDLLYRKRLQALELQGKSKSTIYLYNHAVRRARDYFDSCPDNLTPDNLKEYFTDLLKTHSWSTIKTDRFGLQFFWEKVLNKTWDWIKIVKSPRFKSLPDVLTVAETQELLNTVQKIRYRVYLCATYSMGLRLGEALNLRVSDVDSKKTQVHIRNGKGNKDRFVHLPDATLFVLREFWKTHQNPNLIFPNQNGTAENIRKVETPMDRGGVQEALQAALRDCGIKKHISVHSLRHGFATYLVEANVQLRHIQELLGHANPQTTAIYTRLTEPSFQNRNQAINGIMNRFKIKLA